MCDWVNDDQPYLFEIGNPPLMSFPYSMQTNDAKIQKSRRAPPGRGAITL